MAFMKQVLSAVCALQCMCPRFSNCGRGSVSALQLVACCLCHPGMPAQRNICLCVGNSAREHQQKTPNVEKKNLDSYCQPCDHDNAGTDLCLLMQCCDLHIIVVLPNCPVVQGQEAR